MSTDKPYFIETGEADDIPQPLPMFVTKKRDDRQEQLRAVNYTRVSIEQSQRKQKGVGLIYE